MNGDSVIEFFHDDTYFLNSLNGNDFETIEYRDRDCVITFYPSSNNTVPHFFRATEEDFKELKKITSKSPNFAYCGENYIFSLNNVLSFEKGGKNNCLYVDCKNDDGFIVEINEDNSKDFIMAMQRKWQKTFTEWDQTRDGAVAEEDTLSR